MTLKNDLKRVYEENKDKPMAWVLVGIIVLMLIGALWPVFIIAPGAFFLYAAHTSGRKNSGLIFPGVIITGTGLILLYQSMSGNWESWAYMWTLYPVMVGYALRYHGEHTGSRSEIVTGKNMMHYGLMAFAGFALFFELLIFGSLNAWMLLVVGAGWLWWRGKIKLGSEEQDAAYKEKVRQFVQEKRKNVDINFDGFADSFADRKEKRKNAKRVVINEADETIDDVDEEAVSDELRQRINEVISEMRHVADDIVKRFDNELGDQPHHDEEQPESINEAVEMDSEVGDEESIDEPDNQPVVE